MMRNVFASKHRIAAFITVFALVACTQMPTEKQGISDLRPQISFKVIGDEPSTQRARVLIDGLDVGSVADYAEGVSSARILPGTHLLRVTSGASVLMEERFYLGDGANRSFIVK